MNPKSRFYYFIFVQRTFLKVSRALSSLSRPCCNMRRRVYFFFYFSNCFCSLRSHLESEVIALTLCMLTQIINFIWCHLTVKIITISLHFFNSPEVSTARPFRRHNLFQFWNIWSLLKKSSLCEIEAFVIDDRHNKPKKI